MEDLLSDFVTEAQEMLVALESEIVAWENDPTDRARLDSIFRFFHTVKGNCGFFDFPQLEQLSHAAEDVLADVRAGRREATSSLVDVVLAVIDRISAMIATIERGEDLAASDDATEDARLIARLQQSDPIQDAADERESPVSDSDTRQPPPPHGAQQQQQAQRNALRKRTVRLPVDLLDQIMSGVSDMVLARNDLSRRMAEDSSRTGLEIPFNRLSAMLEEVRDAITRTRMQSIDTIFNSFPRLVRDLAAELGKQVLVEMENGDVELDRELIEVIRDPLIHVIRNAVDHGIETPAERRLAGKREIGVLRISARQTGNEIRVGVIDDGRGIDTQAVVEKALANGLVTPAQVASMSMRERNLLICQPGFSTRKQVTAVSGRGVGMDVVLANLEQIGGSLMIDTTPGSGTRMLLNVPLTLSIVPSLTIGVAGQKFAIPRSYVEEVVRLDTDEVVRSEVGEAMLALVRGRQVPTVPLADVLGIPVDRHGEMLLVLRLVGGDFIGFRCDQVFEHAELVVKPLSPVVMACGFYVGTTQMDDGSPVLMLDVSGVARVAGLIRDVERSVVPADIEQSARRHAESRVPALLFAGMDGTRRVVRMQAIERIERISAKAIRQAGQSAQAVMQDTILPLAGIPNGALLPERVEVMLLSDGTRRLAYAIGEVIDTTTIDADIRPDGLDNDAKAITVIDGMPVEVLDYELLCAQADGAVRRSVRPVCHIGGDDRWSRDFLGPIVEAAGYRLAGIDDREVDLAIVLADAAPQPHATASRVIALRSDREPAPGQDHTIFMEDRDSLREALVAARQGTRA